MSGPLERAIEPAALRAREECPGLSYADTASLSLAVSAKRIADLLESVIQPRAAEPQGPEDEAFIRTGVR